MEFGCIKVHVKYDYTFLQKKQVYNQFSGLFNQKILCPQIIFSFCVSCEAVHTRVKQEWNILTGPKHYPVNRNRHQGLSNWPGFDNDPATVRAQRFWDINKLLAQINSPLWSTAMKLWLHFQKAGFHGLLLYNSISRSHRTRL